MRVIAFVRMAVLRRPAVAFVPVAVPGCAAAVIVLVAVVRRLAAGFVLVAVVRPAAVVPVRVAVRPRVGRARRGVLVEQVHEHAGGGRRATERSGEQHGRSEDAQGGEHGRADFHAARAGVNGQVGPGPRQPAGVTGSAVTGAAGTVRDASTLSILLPSMSTTSSRQSSHTAASPAVGMRPIR